MSEKIIIFISFRFSRPQTKRPKSLRLVVPRVNVFFDVDILQFIYSYFVSVHARTPHSWYNLDCVRIRNSSRSRMLMTSGFSLWTSNLNPIQSLWIILSLDQLCQKLLFGIRPTQCICLRCRCSYATGPTISSWNEINNNRRSPIHDDFYAFTLAFICMGGERKKWWNRVGLFSVSIELSSVNFRNRSRELMKIPCQVYFIEEGNSTNLFVHFAGGGPVTA